MTPKTVAVVALAKMKALHPNISFVLEEITYVNRSKQWKITVSDEVPFEEKTYHVICVNDKTEVVMKVYQRKITPEGFIT